MSGEITINIHDLEGIKYAAKNLDDLQADIRGSTSQIDFGRLQMAATLAVEKINALADLCDKIRITQEVEGFGESFTELNDAASGLIGLSVKRV